jgi:hypothetical protein
MIKLKRIGLDQGMILPVVVILSFIIMAALGTWYRQIVMQSFLSERLIHQRAVLIECRSLLPLLRSKVVELTVDELKQMDTEFLRVDDTISPRWRISRSALMDKKMVFTFEPQNHYPKSVRLTLKIAQR